MGQQFRGGLDEKMRRMWLGREIVPPFRVSGNQNFSTTAFSSKHLDINYKTCKYLFTLVNR